MKGISTRIEKMIGKSGLKPSSFAAQIGVSPSILSHILHGRNKPSLDLILKIHEAFPEVDLDWLLTGKSNETEPDLLPKPIKKEEESQQFSGARIIILNPDGTFEEFEKKNQQK